MPDKKTNGKKPYTQAQITRWLSWLASGMQQHGQTIFLIEHLQPSWLPERRQRRSYVFGCSLLNSLVLGLIIALFVGLIGGIISSLNFDDFGESVIAGLRRLVFGGMVGLLFGVFLGVMKGAFDWSWIKQTGLNQNPANRVQKIIYILVTGVIVAVAYAFSLVLTVGIFAWLSTQEFEFFANTSDYNLGGWATALSLVGIIVSAYAILLWGARPPQPGNTNEIRPVESLNWSWKGAFKAANSVLRFALIVIVLLAVIFLRENWDKQTYSDWGYTSVLDPDVEIAWKEDLFSDLWPGVFAGLVFSLVCAVIIEFLRIRSGSRRDEQSAPIHWSWKRMMKSGLSVFPLAIIIILIALLPSIDDSIPYIGDITGAFANFEIDILALIIFAGLIVALVRSAFVGLISGVVEMKVRPNEGIRLSIRNAFLGGVFVGSFLGLISILLSTAFFRVGDYLDGMAEIMIVSIVIGLLIAVISGFFASLRYGGQEVIRHYVLKFTLYRNNHIPRHFAHFLDYAANELNFLQKVGGGYIFIHRYLLEHFAGITKPQETPK